MDVLDRESNTQVADIAGFLNVSVGVCERVWHKDGSNKCRFLHFLGQDFYSYPFLSRSPKGVPALSKIFYINKTIWCTFTHFLASPQCLCWHMCECSMLCEIFIKYWRTASATGCVFGPMVGWCECFWCTWASDVDFLRVSWSWSWWGKKSIHKRSRDQETEAIWAWVWKRKNISRLSFCTHLFTRD